MDIPFDPNVITDKGKMVPHKVADLACLLNSFKTLRGTDTLYLYEESSGTWIDKAESFVKNALEHNYKGYITSHIVNEVIFHIKSKEYIDSFKTIEGFINLQNGVYDVKEDKVLDHGPQYNFLYCLPFKYDEKATCPKIIEFLINISEPNTKKFLLLLEMLAYPLMPGYPIQKAFMLVGSGQNGKSTYLGLLKNFLGNHNVTSITIQNFDGQFSAYRLIGRLANIGADLPAKKIYDSGMFKMLTGGDQITVDRKFQDSVDFVNGAKLYFSANQIPDIDDTSDAFFRRWIIVEFSKRFEKPDLKILERISTEEEFAGLFNLLIQIFYRKLDVTSVFEYSKDISEIAYEYTTKSNSAKAFIMDCVQQNPDGFVEKQDMFAMIKDYCTHKKLIVPSEKAVTEALFGMGIRFDTSRPTVQGVRKYFYSGFVVNKVWEQEAIKDMEDESQYVFNVKCIEEYASTNTLSKVPRVSTLFPIYYNIINQIWTIIGEKGRQARQPSQNTTKTPLNSNIILESTPKPDTTKLNSSIDQQHTTRAPQAPPTGSTQPNTSILGAPHNNTLTNSEIPEPQTYIPPKGPNGHEKTRHESLSELHKETNPATIITTILKISGGRLHYGTDLISWLNTNYPHLHTLLYKQALDNLTSAGIVYISKPGTLEFVNKQEAE
jgi:P4 family phage/plasmid primase-like protien